MNTFFAALGEELDPTGDRAHRPVEARREIREAAGAALLRGAAEADEAGRKAHEALRLAADTLKLAAKKNDEMLQALGEVQAEAAALRGALAACKERLAEVERERDAARILVQDNGGNFDATIAHLIAARSPVIADVHDAETGEWIGQEVLPVET